MSNKHIFSFARYLVEQDMGAPAEGGDTPEAPKKEKVFSFLFIKKGDKGAKKYPDGSSISSIATYSIKESKLKEWLDTNIVSSDKLKMTDPEIKTKKKSLEQIITGQKTNVSDEERSLLEKFKNAANTGIVAKRTADTEVIFDKGGVPTTNDLDTTFIFI